MGGPARIGYALSAEAIERAWRLLPKRWRDKLAPASSLAWAPGVTPHDGPCWQWQGADSGNGYGKTKDHCGKRWRDRVAHRAIYEHARGPVARELLLDHECRNRRCCNPWHLEPVTVRENTRRGEAVLFGGGK